MPADFDSSALVLPSPVAPVEPAPAPDAPQRTPTRQRLADAIGRVKELEAEVADASAAVPLARKVAWAAQRAFDDAENVLKRARPRDTYFPPNTFHSVWGSRHCRYRHARQLIQDS